MSIAQRAPGRSRVLVGAGVAGVALLGSLLGEFWLFVFSLAVVYVLASLSLVIVTGWSGQLNLHVASFGLGWGAYAAFALTSYDLPVIWAVLGAGVAVAPLAAIVAAGAVRFRGLELAVATLAIGLIFERLFFRNIGKALVSRTGSGTTPFESSFVPMDRPSLFGIDLSGDAAFFYLCLTVALVWFVIVGNLARGSMGRTLRAIREREVMAENLGVPVVRYRIAAVVIATGIAATAGALFASLKLGIAPDSFNLDISFQLLAATVIGGIGSAGGAVIGGSLAALLPEVVRLGPLQIFSGERLFVLFGVGMVLALWRLPTGLIGLAGRGRRTERADDAVVPVLEAGTVSENGARPEIARRVYGSALERLSRPTLLRTDGIRVRFGGVVAVEDVTLSIPRGEVAALIGPNGAGKSTLFNAITGVVAPDAGRVYLDGRDVTELTPHQRAALGVGRTFQNVELFRDMSVIENLMVAGHLDRTAGAVAEAFGLPGARRSEALLVARAREVVDVLGLGSVADRRAGDLPLGLLRVVEVGMAIASMPSLLLLDEPSAGLDPAETEGLGALISRLRSTYGLTVLLVEHDMSLVGAVAEHVFVLDFGRIIAQGPADVVRNDPVVLERYLGEDAQDEKPAPSGRRARARR